MSDWLEECHCGRGWYDPSEYNTCFACYQERRSRYVHCIFCGAWHSPNYDTCYQCRTSSPDRDEAGRNLRMDILFRDEFTCQNCGSQDNPQVDHIEPCAIGGTAAPWNLQVLCRDCNLDKLDQYDWRWEQRRFRLMHLYFTYGWRFLDEVERKQLVEDAAEYPAEFDWHVRNRNPVELVEPPQWAIDMADQKTPA